MTFRLFYCCCLFLSGNIFLGTYHRHGQSSSHTSSHRTIFAAQAIELESNSFEPISDEERQELRQQRLDALKLPPCDIGYFQCTAGDFCVKQQYNCDSIDDCLDGSDEHNCTDNTKTLYYNKLFSKRPDEDREKMTNNCSLEVVPSLQPFCSCSLLNLFCVRKNLTQIPENFPSETNELDLSGNPIYQIRNDSFSKRLRNLKSLIMTRCELNTISPNAFDNLTEISYLNLIGNNISHLHDHTFHNNHQLKILYLSHNPIRSINHETFFGLANLVELDLRYCDLTVLHWDIFKYLHRLEILWLQSNRISSVHVDTFINLRQLDTLSLAYNQLSFVDDAIFTDLINLKSLSLAYNLLQFIPNNNFEDLVSLTKLDLSNNQIYAMQKNAFKYLYNLQSLDLRNNKFKKLPDTIFSELSQLTYIYFDDFKLCSYAQNVRVCTPRGDGISSVQHLLDNIILRISVWIVALIACFGNAFVLISRMLMHELNAVHSFFIKNLAMADFLMGIYLFVIAYHDLRFRNEYIRHEEQWRASWQCHFSGVISTISSESSVFILAVITADRYFSVLYPFSIKRRTMNFAIFSMFLVWSASITLAVIPLLARSLFGDEFYGSNGVCLALQIHETFSMGWEYSTFIFCGLNSIAFIFIAYAYIKMSMTIVSSAIGLRTTQQQQDRNIAKRCGFIVATDCMCWLPIVIIKLLALSGVPINSQLYAWVAIFLLPVNSALNPVLYTLTTKMFKQHLNRIISHNFSSTHRQASNAGDNSSSSFCSINLNHSHNGQNQTATTTQNNLNNTTSSSQNSIYRKFNRKFMMTVFNEVGTNSKLEHGNNNPRVQTNGNNPHNNNSNANSSNSNGNKMLLISSKNGSATPLNERKFSMICLPGSPIYEKIDTKTSSRPKQKERDFFVNYDEGENDDEDDNDDNGESGICLKKLNRSSKNQWDNKPILQNVPNDDDDEPAAIEIDVQHEKVTLNHRKEVPELGC